jgi:hypothetical protein
MPGFNSHEVPRARSNTQILLVPVRLQRRQLGIYRVHRRRDILRLGEHGKSSIDVGLEAL